MRGQPTAEPVTGNRFRTTIWTEVAEAGADPEGRATEALSNLLNRYYEPLHAHISYKFRCPPDQAADLLQEFIHRKVLLARFLSQASRDRGRFRTFLLNGLDNFIANEFRRQSALKRKPEGGLVSFEELGANGQDLPAKGPGDPFRCRFAHNMTTNSNVSTALVRGKLCSLYNGHHTISF